MKYQAASITTLFSAALRCTRKIGVPFLRDAIGEDGQRTQQAHVALFDVGDVFLSTIFIQMRMESHEDYDEDDILNPAADYIEWEFASMTYKRWDGIVYMTPEMLQDNFKLVRLYTNDNDSPYKRAVHLCGLSSCEDPHNCILRVALVAQTAQKSPPCEF